MRILMLGDIVGRPGRRVVQQQLPAVVREVEPDLVIANGENIAGGSGITGALFGKLLSYGIDGVTLGDHAFRQKGSDVVLNEASNLIRPANLPGAAAGRGSMTLTPRVRDGAKPLPPVHVMTVIGRLFVNTMMGDDPFACVDRWLDALDPGAIAIVEMHAETTSEKIAMAHHVDGRVAAVLGTHTHVPTADARVLPSGTAFITDLGMCGPYDSVLGRRKDRVLQFMTTAMPAPFDVAPDEADTRLCGALVTVDEATGRATAIERVERAAELDRPPFAG